MKLKEIKTIFHKELQALYPIEEVNSFFYLLMEHYLGVHRFLLIMDPEYRISKKEGQSFFAALAKLRQEYPIQYITGKAHFMGLELKVNKEVLVPRPETEALVHWILEDHTDKPNPARVLDIGTGSGCIALALARGWPEARVVAMDISTGALDVARENAVACGLELEFLQGDICRLDSLGPAWEVIVSNPPYVRESEKAAMQNNVKQFEPASALFVPDEDPMKYYVCITDFASRNLCAGGLLYLEINQYLGPETCRLLRKWNFGEITLKKDPYGNDRMVKAIHR